MATETAGPARSGTVTDQARRRLSMGLPAAASIAGLLVVAGIGWIAWDRGAMVGLRWVEFDSPLTLAALGFIAGIGGFFAPCAFALFPAYVSYYLSASGATASSGNAVRLGLACAAGAALFFAAVGVAITVLGGALSPYLVALKPAVAVIVIALGLAQVLDIRMPALAVPLRMRMDRGIPLGVAMFVYGFGYALASTGCTLPLYVSITVLPLTSGFSGAALLTFLAFASAMALLMLLTTVLVGLAKHQIVSAFGHSTVWIKRASGVVLMLAGLYLGYFYFTAGM